MFKYIIPIIVFFAFFNFNTPPHEPYEFLHTEHTPSPIQNLCIVNAGLYPLVQAGGIQKAFTNAMLDFLYSHFVYHMDVIYPSPISVTSQNSIRSWWAKHSNNITFHFTAGHNNDYGSSRMINAIRVYDIYKRLQCSAVLSHEYEAPTYYIQVSRPNIPVFIWAHSQHLYTDRMNMRFPKTPMVATVYSMEKYVLEKATTVFAPSYWYINWMRNNHIKLPMTYRIANPNTKLSNHVILLPNHSNHFIFYSRIEPLKGINHFLHIANHFCNKATFTVIGITKNPISNPCVEYKSPPNFQTVLNTIQPNSIVLGLSLADTSSYTLQEMFQHKIPFLTYPTGGIPELFETEYVPDLKSMLSRVHKFITHRGSGYIRAIIQNNRFDGIYDAITSLHSIPVIKPIPRFNPTMTFVITSHNRPNLLKQAISSLNKSISHCKQCQMKIIDSSTTHIKADYHLPSITPLTSIRNVALTIDTDYICYFDDDDVAMEHMAITFHRMARYGADILTSFAQVNPKNYLSLALETAYTEPILHLNSKANFCVNRTKAIEIGGHTTFEYFPEATDNAPYVDWAFILKAYLNNMTFHLTPQPLYYYIKHDNEKSIFDDATATSIYQAKYRITSEILKYIPNHLHIPIEAALYAILPREHNIRSI
jgi:hypothetical protein